MRHLDLVTVIGAPPERVFDDSLEVAVHTGSMAARGERAVAGVTSGRLRLGDEVTWQARHFGLRWRMTSRITAHRRPTYFVDEQVAGPFARWRHEHHFAAQPGDTTLMRDVIVFAAPYGPLGRLTELVLLKRYMTMLLVERNEHLAAVCRADRPA